jgi:hypothetical protein
LTVINKVSLNIRKYSEPEYRNRYNTQNSLKLSQTQINKKAGFRIIPQFPQRYFWGICVPQKYLYVICVLGVCSIGNDVTDYAGLSEPF